MPVPPAAVRFRMVLEVNVPMGLLLRIPLTIVPVAVEVEFIELAMFPPTVLLLQVQVTPEPVLQRMPYKLAAPVLELLTVIPPILLLLVTQFDEPKLKMPITSAAEVELEVNVMLPVDDISPIVLPVTSPIVVRPLET